MTTTPIEQAVHWKKTVEERIKEAADAAYNKGFDNGVHSEKQEQLDKWILDHPIKC